MKRHAQLVTLIILLSVLPLALLHGQAGDFLTEEEQAKLRDAQDPSERIKLYLKFSQARLDRLEEFRKNPVDSEQGSGPLLGTVLNQYISIIDELKDWINYQYQRHADMRHGLRDVLEQGPKQLDELHGIQQSAGPSAHDYSETLNDAIADLKDTLDGSTKALDTQGKKFTKMKQEEKTDARAAKERRKQEEKLNKQERKLEKKQHEHAASSGPDDDQ